MSFELIKTDLAISEVAEVLGISRGRVYAIIKSGKLHKMDGRRGVRVSVEELERYLADYHAKLPFSLGL